MNNEQKSVNVEEEEEEEEEENVKALCEAEKNGDEDGKSLFFTDKVEVKLVANSGEDCRKDGHDVIGDVMIMVRSF